MASSVEQIIDKEIQQLIELKKMSGNPRMVELMREIVNRSPNGTPLPVTAQRRPTPANKSAPNGLSAAVLSAVRTFKGKRFVVGDVQKRMLDAGFSFVAKNRRVAIGGVLEALGNKRPNPIVKIAEKGVGGKPNSYEYLGE